jgi:hypothetical protein
MVTAVRVQKAEDESRRNTSAAVPVGARHFDDRAGCFLRPFGEVEYGPAFAQSAFRPRPKVIKGQPESVTGLLGGLCGRNQGRGGSFGRDKMRFKGFDFLLGRSKLSVSFVILLVRRIKVSTERLVVPQKNLVFSIRLL